MIRITAISLWVNLIILWENAKCILSLLSSYRRIGKIVDNSTKEEIKEHVRENVSGCLKTMLESFIAILFNPFIILIIILVVVYNIIW